MVDSGGSWRAQGRFRRTGLVVGAGVSVSADPSDHAAFHTFSRPVEQSGENTEKVSAQDLEGKRTQPSMTSARPWTATVHDDYTVDFVTIREDHHVSAAAG